MGRGVTRFSILGVPWRRQSDHTAKSLIPGISSQSEANPIQHSIPRKDDPGAAADQEHGGKGGQTSSKVQLSERNASPAAGAPREADRRARGGRRTAGGRAVEEDGPSGAGVADPGGAGD